MNSALTVTLGSHGFRTRLGWVHQALANPYQVSTPREKGLNGGRRWTRRRSTMGGFATTRKFRRSRRASFVGSATSSHGRRCRESMLNPDHAGEIWPQQCLIWPRRAKTGSVRSIKSSCHEGEGVARSCTAMKVVA
ncbi:hypothetical protein CRG98_006871 [Punica granatum]|uniref:Uncharacterized protein n=1 Tax=Punica granatum TaxID=22663 RepID=A0A2I0KW87_PUNGR|nr:hypothetical protein CRG98_006871 [Punica granatum]